MMNSRLVLCGAVAGGFPIAGARLRTTGCAAQAAKIGAFVPAPVSKGNTTSPVDLAEDQFYWMNKINKASIVMLVEEKILPPRERAHDRTAASPTPSTRPPSPAASGPPT